MLTAARSGEVRNAVWSEIDLNERTWFIPAERMKNGKAHRVPLCERAIEILTEARAFGDDDGLIFPSTKGGALGSGAFAELLRDCGIDAVPHGFRTSFRTWAAEQTDAPREVCEHALAHVNGNQVEAAYQRSDLFEKRRELLNQWARYVTA